MTTLDFRKCKTIEDVEAVFIESKAEVKGLLIFHRAVKKSIASEFKKWVVKKKFRDKLVNSPGGRY